jgi:hypothetical protein
MPDQMSMLLDEVASLRRRIAIVETQERNAQTLMLVDGITAPSAVAGLAIMFVDTSDGDLKIIFGDGTTNTIVADT